MGEREVKGIFGSLGRSEEGLPDFILLLEVGSGMCVVDVRISMMYLKRIVVSFFQSRSAL